MTGESSEQITEAIKTLPPAPEGDLEVVSSVRQEAQAWQFEKRRLELLGPRPAEGDSPEYGGLDEHQLRMLASELELEDPVASDDESRLVSAARAARESARHPVLLPAAITVLAAISAVILVFVDVLVGAIVAGVIAVAGITWLWWWLASNRELDQAFLSADAALEPYRARRDSIRLRREDAAERVRAAGLQPVAGELRMAADEIVAWEEAQRKSADWDARHSAAEEALRASAQSLLAALQAQGQQAEIDDLDSGMAEYEAACRARRQQADEAPRRGQLEAALVSRQLLEARATDADERIERALGLLRDACGRAHLSLDDPTGDEMVEALETWRVQIAREREAHAQAEREWNELEGILGGASLDEVRARVEELEGIAERLSEGIEPAAISAVGESDLTGQRLRDLRSQVDERRKALSELDGRLSTMTAALPGVTAAEERLQRARVELDRVRRLEQVLDRTIKLLEGAEERVHRDTAPILATAATPALERVTGGRYIGVSVDPATLDVKVKEAASGRWRDAHLLSRGTAEQVYLLLRAALASLLVKRDEKAPLLLDEVTAQSDDIRSAAILTTLHDISRERQIVLFSHDDDVAEWAEANLDHEVDALIRLSARAGKPRPTEGA